VLLSYTVTRIDGKLHQPHRMAPDQTIRAMEKKFDICDVHIWFFPTFPMKIFDCFRSFPIIFPFQRMEIPYVSKFSDYIPLQRMEIPYISKISDYIPFSKYGNPRRFEVFR
jgi:hypothetical protein